MTSEKFSPCLCYDTTITTLRVPFEIQETSSIFCYLVVWKQTHIAEFNFFIPFKTYTVSTVS